MIDILLIVCVCFCILYVKSEGFYVLSQVNPYYEGMSIDISKIQMQSIMDTIKGKLYDYQLNHIDSNDTLDTYKIKLNKEKYEINPVFSFSDIKIIIDLINKEAKQFYDPDLTFLNNQPSISFLATNPELISTQNTHPYRYVDGRLITRKHLLEDNAKRCHIELNIKKLEASTYYVIKLEYDIYNDNIIRIINTYPPEKKTLIKLRNMISLNNLDLNCIHCSKKKPSLKDNIYYKNVIYNNMKNADKHNFICSTKNTNNKRVCKSKEILNDGTILDPGKIYRYKCVSDYQCPMWRSNKNYPNNRGACINNVCEFPIGLVPTSSVKFDKNTEAICHSRNTSKESCADQLNDPRLASPDYAFAGDFNERLIYNKHLKKKGLRVQNLIST